jgi:hypothetical protein
LGVGNYQQQRSFKFSVEGSPMNENWQREAHEDLERRIHSAQPPLETQLAETTTPEEDGRAMIADMRRANVAEESPWGKVEPTPSPANTVLPFAELAQLDSNPWKRDERAEKVRTGLDLLRTVGEYFQEGVTPRAQDSNLAADIEYLKSEIAAGRDAHELTNELLHTDLERAKQLKLALAWIEDPSPVEAA